MNLKLLVILTLSPLLVIGQSDDRPTPIHHSTPKIQAQQIAYLDMDNSEVFFNEWSQGQVFLSTGDTVSNLKLRYDMLEDRLIWAREEDMTFGEIDKRSITGFGYTEEGLYHRFKLVGRHTHYEVLTDGKYGLYARRKLGHSLYGKRLLRSDRYFLVRENKFLYYVKVSKKSLLKAYPESMRAQLKKELKSQKIKIKREEDLAKAVALSNEQ